MAVKVPITDIWRAIVVAKFKRKLAEAKCSSGNAHLCPNHVLRIFEEVLNEHTLNVDTFADTPTTEEPSTPPKED
jgi:hypothetical protein